MMFGGINETQYVGELHTFKLATNKWWALNFRSLVYNGQSIRYYASDEAIGVIDTGTSMMAIPEDLHSALSNRWARSIGSKAQFACQQGLCLGGAQCSFFEDILGNLTLVIDDNAFNIMPRGYLLNGIDLDPQLADMCIFGVMPLPSMVGSMQMFLLGDVFLRNFYSVYDLTEQKVSLALNLHAKDYAGIGEYQGSFLWYLLAMCIAMIASVFVYRFSTQR